MYRNVSCAGFDYEITSVRLKKLEIFVYIFLQNLEGLNMSRFKKNRTYRNTGTLGLRYRRIRLIFPRRSIRRCREPKGNDRSSDYIPNFDEGYRLWLNDGSGVV